VAQEGKCIVAQHNFAASLPDGVADVRAKP
jgi:hypothetical protein